nr:hypothetical protein [uncultured Undibacterium sp.]
MKKISTQQTKFISLIALFGLLIGCASIAVTDDVIAKKTAFELGLNASDFTISNRENDGAMSTYIVKTKDQRTYNCSIGGSISVLGRTVSSPICNEVGKKSGAAPSTSSGATCNALLKAAGKC